MEWTKDCNLEFTKEMNLMLGIPVFLPESFTKWSRVKRGLWTAYQYVGTIIVSLQVFLFVLTIVHEFEDTSTLFQSFGVGAFLLQVPIKIWILKSMQQQFESTADDITVTSRMLSANPVKDTGYPPIYHKAFKIIKLVSFGKLGVEVFGTTSLIVFFVTTAYIYNDETTRDLPGHVWLPYDYIEMKAYLATCGFQFFALLFTLIKVTALDVMLVTVLIVDAMQLKYLKKLLKIIIEEFQQNDEELTEEEEKVVTTRFDWWIIMHQRVLKSIEDFKKFTSPVLVLHYFLMSIDTCLLGVFLFSVSSWNFIQKATATCVTMEHCAHLYIMSIIGDELYEDSVSIADEAFNVKFFKCNRYLAKNYLFVLARAKKAVELRAANAHPLSRRTFRKIVRLAFSYFLTIVQVQSSRHDSQNAHD